MTDNILISVIVPVYNSDKSLRRCVNSVLAQTYPNIELILVNDGSKDNSADIIDEYVAKDCRIKAIHKQNSGVSAARNVGIDVASGDFILFIDSDDYIEANYVNAFIAKIDDGEILLISDIDGHNSKTAEQVKFIIGTNKNSQLSICDALVDGRLLFFGYPFGKLYSKLIIDKYGLRFQENVSLKEDLIFMLDYLKHCHQVKFIGSAGYNYIVQANSLSTTKYPAQTLIGLTEQILLTAYSLEIDWNEPPQSQLLSDFLAVCIREIFDSLFYYHKQVKKNRILQLKYLRRLLPKSMPYPNNYKTDIILRKLYYLKAYSLFDSIQIILFSLRTPLNQFHNC